MKPDVAALEAAWVEFGESCSETVAPEATYQAWLAHFVIQKLGLLRVVREVDFGAHYLGPEAAVHFTGSNLMVDLLVLHEPVTAQPLAVDLPRRSWLGPRRPYDGLPNPRSGLERLKDFSIITELKVSASQGGGLSQSEVLRDFLKLSAILDKAEEHYPNAPLPTAFVGVLDNHVEKRFNFEKLRDRMEQSGTRPDVRLLSFQATEIDPSAAAT